MSSKKRQLTGLVSVATALALCFTIAPGAAAAAPDPANEAADLIAEVAPDQGTVVGTTPKGDTLVSSTESGETVVSTDVDEPITFIQNDSDTGGVLEVPLPDEVQLEAPVVADDGTVFYEGVNGTTDVAVQTLADSSIRLQTIIPEGSGASVKFTYDFGADARVLEDAETGQVYVEQGDTIVAEIDDAWAYDAEGQPVPTSYEIREDSIVQKITPTRGTVYPIVADPKFITGTNNWFGGRFVAARFTIAETTRIAAGGAATAAIGTLIGMVPGPHTAIARSVLQGIGATLVLWAGGARALNKCVELRYYYIAHKAYGLYYSGTTKGCR
ncbi:hypothetical protein [Isoptericola sp. NPDC056134]|uniref:hypothetical protein n=1 Tax=Isoptericola sp. NPDC056134 TaxID=3345723 RepID=UPI0035E8BDE1